MAEDGGWKLSIVGQGEVDPRTLVKHPLNPKVHTTEQDRVVEASLRQFGWLRRLLVNRVTGHLLDGEERLELALRRGEKTVHVDYVEVAAEQEGAVQRTLDQSAALAVPDWGRWAQLQAEGHTETEEPALLAFWGKLAAEAGRPDEARAARAAELEAGRKRARERRERGEDWEGSWTEERRGMERELEREARTWAEKWGVEAGQMWEVGRHRVLCGDSTDVGVVRRLMQGEQVDLVVTSPPYGADKGYERGTGPEAHRELLRQLGRRCSEVVVAGGFVAVNFGELWAQLTARAWTGRERACLYPMSREYWELWWGELGWELYASRVWVKPYARLRQPLWTYHTSLAHQQEWEFVWTWRLPGGEGEAVYDWEVSGHAVWSSVGEVDTDGSGPWRHWSAGFPQYIPNQILKAHSEVGAVVWEPFLGAGTTLLSCEELGRTCLGSDVDPGAIGVTLQRWHEQTGESPHLMEHTPTHGLL